MHWNFASTDWHCPNATNKLEVGGEFHYIMAAKGGSESFDFWGTYQSIEFNKHIDILLGDGRKMIVSFEETSEGTLLTEQFEPETMNAIELQEAGWQSILDNFKNYTAYKDSISNINLRIKQAELDTEFDTERKEKEILISAQAYLINFYNNLGFVQKGEQYLEDDIPHIKMLKS